MLIQVTFPDPHFDFDFAASEEDLEEISQVVNEEVANREIPLDVRLSAWEWEFVG